MKIGKLQRDPGGEGLAGFILICLGLFTLIIGTQITTLPAKVFAGAVMFGGCWLAIIGLLLMVRAFLDRRQPAKHEFRLNVLQFLGYYLGWPYRTTHRWLERRYRWVFVEIGKIFSAPFALILTGVGVFSFVEIFTRNSWHETGLLYDSYIKWSRLANLMELDYDVEAWYFGLASFGWLALIGAAVFVWQIIGPKAEAVVVVDKYGYIRSKLLDSNSEPAPKKALDLDSIIDELQESFKDDFNEWTTWANKHESDSEIFIRFLRLLHSYQNASKTVKQKDLLTRRAIFQTLSVYSRGMLNPAHIERWLRKLSLTLNRRQIKAAILAYEQACDNFFMVDGIEEEEPEDEEVR